MGLTVAVGIAAMSSGVAHAADAGPRIVWQQATDAAGTPVFSDGIVTPLDVDRGADRMVLLVEEASQARRLWQSPDGRTWERLPDLPMSAVGSRVDGVVAYRHGWVAHGEDPEGRVVLWSSADGIEWERLSDTALRAFRGSTIVDIVASRRGLVAHGRATRGARGQRLWVSRSGRRWRERRDFAKDHPGARIVSMGAMGDHVVTFGRSGPGRTAAWVAPISRLNQVTKMWRGSVPRDPAPPTSLYVGRDAALAVVPPSEPETQPELWRSIDSWDWQRLASSGRPEPGSQTAYASDGELIVSHAATPDGRHDIRVSSDGETWQHIPTEGEVPRTVAPSTLVASPTGIVLISGDGVWQGAWRDRAAAVLPRPIHPQPAVGPIGADAPLRPPVVRPKGRRPLLDTSGRASVRRERGGVRLEMWLPRERVRQGEWLPAHVRITNTGARSITFGCGGASTRAETAELFPPGERWDGNAAAFKVRLLASDSIGGLPFGAQRGDGDDCPGSVGLEIKLMPGETYEYDVWTVPRHAVRDQPLPSGRLPVVTRFGWESGDSGRRRLLTVQGSVRFVGPRWHWATPQELVDAMLTDPRFKDWLDRRDRPIWWDNTTFHVVDKPSFYWYQLGFEGPAPDGTVHIGLFAYSWRTFGGSYGRVLLDPWTGQVLGFAS